MTKARARKPAASPAAATTDRGVTRAGDASPARTDGQRLLRASPLNGGEIAKRIGVSRNTVHEWRRGTKSPGPEMRDALALELGIPAQAWGRAPVDRPASPPSPSPAVTSTPRPGERPSTLDDVLQLLAELDADASADGVLPSDRARIRDTKTKALALKARIEAQDALFEAQAITKHPAWRRIRTTIVESLRPYPDAARAVATALQEADAA